jgi:very-short-patch-repair endonuclease
MAITSLPRTLLDCARTLPLAESVAVIDCALRRFPITKTELDFLAGKARGPRSVALRQAIAMSDVSCGSVIESPLRLLLQLLGADVRAQVLIRGIGTFDFVVDGWLVVEADGFAFHSDRGAYRADRRRANLLAERGMVLLRFTWEDIVLRPEQVLAQVRAVLELGPPRR